MLPAPAVYDEKGARLALGPEIGRGGEGIIYALPQNPLECAKIYGKPLPREELRKLEVMVASAPDDPTWATQKHRSIAWPSALLYRGPRPGDCAGFTMPKIDTKTFRKALYYLDPTDRTKLLGGEFNWKYLFTTAYNITSAVAAVHARGHLIGDLNESNILVAANTLITLIDCDSFQIRDPNTNKVFRCPVGKPEYTAPEVQGKSYREVDRTLETDSFALAVLLFQFLMDGTHPYQAKGRLVDDAASTQAKIVKGYFPYAVRPGKDLAPPDYALPYEILPPEIGESFRRCFEEGHKNPQARPSARDWFDLFRKFGYRFKQCRSNPNHFFLDHLTACPWCEVIAKKGKDPFPSPIGQQVALAAPSIPRLEISKSRFEFRNLRAGEVRTGSVVISNVGGGALQGTFRSNQPWLRVLRSQIDPRRQRQEIEFEVHTGNLPLGLRQTGTIEIRSNGGTEQILVDLSVKAPKLFEKATWRSGLALAVGIVGAIGLPLLVLTQKQRVPTSPAVAPLQVGAFTTTSAVTARRNYSPKNQFRPGDQVCLFAEALDVGKGQKIDLLYDFRVSAPNDAQFWARNRRHSGNTREPSFAAWDCFSLPGNALPGSYTASVQVRNNLTGQLGARTMTFSVSQTSAQPISASGRQQTRPRASFAHSRSQEGVSPPAPGAAQPTSQIKIQIPEGTRIRVRLEQTLSSATSEVGQPVQMSVVEHVKMDDTILIAEGAKVTGKVLVASPKRRLGRTGKLDFSAEYVTAVDGAKIPLRYTVNKREGGSHGLPTGLITAGVLVAFRPAAPFFLLMKGKDTTVDSGVTFELFTDQTHTVEVYRLSNTAKK